ncbi:MAG: hypothetical protein JW888_06400 [Pirellulales bacterium]|nr:hypothetical protein [Pirellulales bacterium]
MKTRAARRTYLLSMVVSVCCLWLCASPCVCELPDAIKAAQQKAAERFAPLGSSQVAEAKDDVCRTVNALETRLDQDGQNGLAWRKYLRLDKLRAELDGSDAPDLEKFDEVYTRLNGDYRGLELVWFVDLKLALQRYLNVARAIGNPEIEAAYKNLVANTLPERLEALAADGSRATANQIGPMLAWLADFRQADELVRLSREHYSRPNVFIEVSGDFIGAGMGKPIDETTPVRDVILGTTIRGTGQTKGQVAVELIPSDDHGVLEIVLSAETHTDNTGYHGPVRIYTTGVTTSEGRKRLVITPERIEALPATSHVTTTSTINCIRSRRNSKFVERAAWRRACEQKSQAEAIAAQHAECRVNRRMDEQTDELIAEANDGFQKRFRGPLWQRRVFPEQLVVNTTEQGLYVRALRSAYNQLAATNDPPELAGPADVALRVHESLINNSAATLVAGRLVDEEEFLKTVEDILGEVPESLAPEEGKASWSIQFAPSDAFVVAFDDGGFTISMHATGYVRAEKEYPGMNVSASYKIEKTDEGFVAVRQGDLEVYPPDFVKGKRQLSAREQTLREMLTKRFAKIFNEKIVPRGYLEPKGRWEKVGRVPLSQWTTQDGWMTLAWKKTKP